MERRWVWLYLMLLSRSLVGVTRADYDYKKALELGFYFFEAQRSGYLPASERVDWRANSGLNDGKEEGVDLVGGYYDAGDNVKFQLPMAFTITTLSWSVIEYGAELQNMGQLQHALDCIKWGTDYFIKAHPEPNVLWVEVGDGDSDHSCWQRPEDMTTPRKAWKIDASNPGSEVAAETAAAMAAASIVFRASNSGYAGSLLYHAKQLFNFADVHRGRYDSAIPIVKKYYPSGPSGYNDELLWAAFWLFEATSEQYYLNYGVQNAQVLGGIDWGMTEFSWDVKYAGVQVLASKILMEGRGGKFTSTLQSYQKQADFFMCAALNKNGGNSIHRSPGGLMWTQPWNNMQFVTSAAFLLTAYGDYLAAAKLQLHCSGSPIGPSDLLSTAKAQIDYILGSNPKGFSYMVGFGTRFPNFVHHRGASIVSIKKDSRHIGCCEGYATWYTSREVDPNVLSGALVGGPDRDDHYNDKRENYNSAEACVYNNAPLVGILARLTSTSRAY